MYNGIFLIARKYRKVPGQDATTSAAKKPRENRMKGLFLFLVSASGLVVLVIGVFLPSRKMRAERNLVSESACTVIGGALIAAPMFVKRKNKD